MCDFKVQGTQVLENEVLHLQLNEEIVSDCEHYDENYLLSEMFLD